MVGTTIKNRLFICLSILLILPLPARCQDTPPDVLQDRSIYEISLLTFSPADRLFEWFGHTALAVTNRQTGQSETYNFGGFSFNKDDFLMFTMGQFTFWSYKQDTAHVLRYYRQQNRHIIIQKLDLTRDQTTRIRRSLMRSMLPRNRYYTYDHFKDNCATRLRDIVDNALGGAIRKQASDNTGGSYRDLVHRMTAHQPTLDFLINFILSDGVDKPVSYWETMFLPDRLMAVFQSSRNPETGRPLVSSRDEIIPQNRSPFFLDNVEIPDTTARDWMIGLTFALPLLLSALLYFRSIPGSSSRKTFSRRLYPGLVAFFGLVCGALGLVLFIMAVIGSHKDVYWNENAFLAHPVTFLLLPLGLLSLMGKTRRSFAAVSLISGLGAITGFCLKLLPSFDQVNGQQLRILLPSLIIIGVSGLLELRQSTQTS